MIAVDIPFPTNADLSTDVAHSDGMVPPGASDTGVFLQEITLRLVGDIGHSSSSEAEFC